MGETGVRVSVRGGRQPQGERPLCSPSCCGCSTSGPPPSGPPSPPRPASTRGAGLPRVNAVRSGAARGRGASLPGPPPSRPGLPPLARSRPPEGAPAVPREREALREAGPDRGRWTWWGDSRSPRTCGAAARHQLQEIAVHAYDARVTASRPPTVPVADRHRPDVHGSAAAVSSRTPRTAACTAPPCSGPPSPPGPAWITAAAGGRAIVLGG
ncbi:maleylpyruvate isomerase N-terminal domain-containing protein [Streptomyces tricolor]|uniref:maleylpyruvate isomerase N-terminal domain-containing protein n=1 Tax=Streptomyces tricolor TaxID=68277 RepID=UPI00380E619E